MYFHHKLPVMAKQRVAFRLS